MPAFVASTNADAFISTPATVDCNVPAGVVDDDFLLAFVTLNSTSWNIVPPAGWTLLDVINHDVNQPLQSSIYYRVASSEPPSYAWGHDSTNKWIGIVCQAWRDVNSSTPFDAVYSQGLHTENYPTDANPPNEPITTVTDGAEVVLFHHHRGSLDTTAAPTGYTLDSNSRNAPNRCLQIAYKTVPTAGVEAPGDWLHTDAAPEDSNVWTIALRPPTASRVITDIDGDDDVQVGQTSVTITCTGLDSSPATQTATLGGESLTITDWNSGNPIVTIPVDIALKWGRTDLDLVVTDDTGAVTLNNVTLSAEAGWEYVNFSGTAPGAGTESGYELVQADHSYALLAGDQWIFESETGLSYDADTLPTVNPPSTITSQYRYWNDSAGTMSAKTAYSIAQQPVLTGGLFIVDALLAGSMVGVGVVTGGLESDNFLAGNIVGTGIASGDLHTEITLSGGLLGIADVAGNIEVALALQGVLVGAGLVGGRLTIDDQQTSSRRRIKVAAEGRRITV